MIRKLLKTPPGPDSLLQFNQELLGIVRARIPLDQGLAMVGKELAAGQLKEAVAEVERRISQGASLSEAVGGQRGAFPENYQKLIAVGERMGNLTGVLEFLVSHYQRQASFQRTMISLMVYPLTVLTLAMGVIGGILTIVMPKFLDIFLQMGAKLPWLTQQMMDISDILIRNGLLVIVLAFGLLYWVFSLRNIHRPEWEFLRHLPLVSAVYRCQVCATFLGTMGMLLKSGVPALEALALTRMAIVSKSAQKEIAAGEQRLEQGTELGCVLAELRFLPAVSAGMMRSASERPDLADCMTSVAEYYDAKMRMLQNNAIGLFEPLLLVILGGTIAMMVLALYLPLFDLPRNIK